MEYASFEALGVTLAVLIRQWGDRHVTTEFATTMKLTNVTKLVREHLDHINVQTSGTDEESYATIAMSDRARAH